MTKQTQKERTTATLDNLYRKLLKVNTAVFRNMRIKTSPDGVVSVYVEAKVNKRHSYRCPNNKIKLLIRRSYGFRNIDSMLNMIYLTCSDLKIPLPNRPDEEVIAV